jgi:hypothetical protein
MTAGTAQSNNTGMFDSSSVAHGEQTLARCLIEKAADLKSRVVMRQCRRIRARWRRMWNRLIDPPASETISPGSTPIHALKNSLAHKDIAASKKLPIT